MIRGQFFFVVKSAEKSDNLSDDFFSIIYYTKSIFLYVGTTNQWQWINLNMKMMIFYGFFFIFFFIEFFFLSFMKQGPKKKKEYKSGNNVKIEKKYKSLLW